MRMRDCETWAWVWTRYAAGARGPPARHQLNRSSWRGWKVSLTCAFVACFVMSTMMMDVVSATSSAESGSEEATQQGRYAREWLWPAGVFVVDLLHYVYEMMIVCLVAAQTFALISAVLLLSLVMYERLRAVSQSVDEQSGEPRLVVAFFHPFCNSAGGGERVLWRYIHALQEMNPRVHCVIYTADHLDTTPAQIVALARDRFDLPPFPRPITFVRMRYRSLLSDKLYPRATMLLQSLASSLVAFFCLHTCKPHVFIDTTGFAFTFPVASLMFGCHVSAYVHYPTISTDMLSMVYERRPSYNNAVDVVNSRVKNTVKLLYYVLFAALYGAVGRLCSLTMVNSTWTHAHIARLWGSRPAAVAPSPAPVLSSSSSPSSSSSSSTSLQRSPFIVYPPCGTKTLQLLPLAKVHAHGSLGEQQRGKDEPFEYRELLVISVGQFRPEKDHALQLRSFARFLALLRERGVSGKQDLRLVLIGGCRNADDEARIADLRTLAETLRISEHVHFVVNAPFSELQTFFQTALVGLHTMWNEHFGIGVVEFQAAGVIALAHNSGGPKTDIIVPHDGVPTGFLAATEEEYAQALFRIFCTSFTGSADMQRMREAARVHAAHFSDEEFTRRLHHVLHPWLSEIESRVIR